MSTTCRSPSPASSACAVLAALLLAAPGAFAQIYDSGSTGAFGPLTPDADVTVALPEDGVIHATAIIIPAGVTVTFARNAANTPVTLLSTTDIFIEGAIDISGAEGAPASPETGFDALGGLGGPGGSSGGSSTAAGGTNGLGPGGGGGTSICNAGGGASPTAEGRRGGGCTCSAGGGPTYAEPLWTMLHGGSGGGASHSGAGGGGAGGITIAATGTLTMEGLIRANGGDAWLQGGAGGAGTIRLIADIIEGSGLLQASGGSGGACVGGGSGGDGLIRLEAFELTGDLATFAFPAPETLLPSAAAPYSATELPRLRIVSVAEVAVKSGVVVPAHPHTRPPIGVTAGSSRTVLLEAQNVPLGTIVTVAVGAPGRQRQLVESTPLVGSATLSTATATIVVPDAEGRASLEAWVGSAPLP